MKAALIVWFFAALGVSLNAELVHCGSIGEAWAKATADAVNNSGAVVRIAPTGSMKPTLDERCVVVIKKLDRIERGQIVVYRAKCGNLVIHRAVSQPLFSKSEWFVKGDANTQIDREFLTAKNYVGTVVSTYSY